MLMGIFEFGISDFSKTYALYSYEGEKSGIVLDDCL